MNRYIGLLLISILALDVSAKNPFEDTSTSDYIELRDMRASATHVPLPNDPHPETLYHPLGESAYHSPDNDLREAKPSRSTIRRRMFQTTFPQPQGCLILLKACLACCFQPESRAIADSGDNL